MPLSRERKIELLGAMPLFEGLDADLAKRVRQLQAAGAAADDDDRVRPGWERSRGHPHRFAQLRNRWALWSRRVCACSIR